MKATPSTSPDDSEHALAVTPETDFEKEWLAKCMNNLRPIVALLRHGVLYVYPKDKEEHK